MSLTTYRPRKNFKVGDYVVMKNREGYIRYIGKREHHHGTWYGIELVVGFGPNDGSEHGKRYFACKQRHGIFVRLYAIKSKIEHRSVDPRKLNNKAHTALPLLPQSKTLSDADTCSVSSTSTMRTPSPKEIRMPTRAPTFRNNERAKTHYYNLRVNDRPESTRGSNSLSPWKKPPPVRPKSARHSNKKSSTRPPQFQLSSPRRPPSSPRTISRSPSPRIDYKSDDMSSSAPSSATDTSDSDDIMVLTPKKSTKRNKFDFKREKNERSLSMNRARSSNDNHVRHKPNKIRRKKPPKRNKSRQKNKAKNRPNKGRNARLRTKSNEEPIRDRDATDNHDMKSIFHYKKRTNSTPQNEQRAMKLTDAENTKKPKSIKAYNKRQSYRRRKSKTLDFGITTKTKELLREIEGQTTEDEETSDDDDDDDDDDYDEYTNDNDIGKKIALPSLKNSHSTGSGKYTFRLHIKNNSNKQNASDRHMECGRNDKEYRLVLPDKEEEEIPLRLKQSYSLRSNHDSNGNRPQLSVAVSDNDNEGSDGGDEEEDEYYEAQSRITRRTSSRSLTDFSESLGGKTLWKVPVERDTDPLDGVGFTSMKPPELSDDLLFISQNNLHDIPIRLYGNKCFEIEESVIEYHVPSMTKINRNKNIKINIHINNDINNKKKGTKLQPKQKQKQKHNKTVSAINPSKQKHISGNKSVGSSMNMMKMKKKKKKRGVGGMSKHKHSHRDSHHHHKSKHKSKKNCSCHKHNKEKKKEKEKKKKDKRDKKGKKGKQQIKFRPKLPQKSKTPRARGSMPPPPISQRSLTGFKQGHHHYGNAQRFAWNGLI